MADRKPSDGLEYITNNTAYGTTTTSPEIPDPTPGPDGVEYDEISCETAAQPEIKADEAHSYCYAAYDNVKHPYAPDRRSALISSDDNSYFVLGKETQQGDRHEQAQPALTQQQAEQEQLHHKQESYFVLEKSGSRFNIAGKDVDESADYFVVERAVDECNSRGEGNGAEEITSKYIVYSGKSDDHYLQVEKCIVVETEHSETTSDGTSNTLHVTVNNHSSNGDYFVLDNDGPDVPKQTEVNIDGEVDDEAGIQTDTKVGGHGETGAKYGINVSGIIKEETDYYDHVKIGHVQTNGFDDGIYDQLRKQHVRCEIEEVDNDYDHC
ncbi:uncharacterized protein LOC117331040 [Pecten maximus]|uniref:uncharacterized protein LOC117331040 n=1 Tax=Pecten maximus TaxID=6579 RepID=UPI001458318A|nr:uncharacterized protein LOC117331040 [Pecten maximus]